MKIFIIVLLATSITSISRAGIGDGIAKIIFQKKVDELYKRALQCSPLEKDSHSKMDVTDWLKIQPQLPEWQMLPQVEETAREARDYAKTIGGKDKTLHCLAGCYVAKKLDYKSAVLVGWLKELSDSSDCSKKTSFEKKDYDATIKGAKGINSDKNCENFCLK